MKKYIFISYRHILESQHEIGDAKTWLVYRAVKVLRKPLIYDRT